MCLYDRRRLHARHLDHMLATHPSVVIDGHHRSNPFYRPSTMAADRTAKPEDLNWKLATLRQQS